MSSSTPCAHLPEPSTDPHAHTHTPGASPARLGLALALALSYMVAEILGGLLSNSLALLSDAGHMASDAAALALALWATRLSRRPPNARRTYGYHRAEVLAALLNATALGAVAISIVVEAVQRLLDPTPVQSTTMLAVATGGLLVNLIMLAVLSHGGHSHSHGGHSHDLNTRGALLHVLGDTLGSVGAIAAALLIRAYGWTWTDPLAGALIGLLILLSTASLIRDSVAVLMASAPPHLDVDTIRAALADIDGVTGIHDLHVWTLSSGLILLTAHADLDPAANVEHTLDLATALCHDRFGIEHSTIQPTFKTCGAHTH